jgi:undecaprenyl pyrophosphate phosphatase UppP
MSVRKCKTLVCFETALSGITGLLAVVTVFWKDWIEALTGVAPDHGNGTVEVGVIIGLVTASVITGFAAQRTLRRQRPVATST